MAKKARSQGITSSLPSISKNCILPFSSFHSISAILSPVTSPASFLVNSLVRTDHKRSTPSSRELEVLSVIGHSGHGFKVGLRLGGFGSNSNWVMKAAPCLLDVPIQSLPVSPPPMTSTCFPGAFMWFLDSKSIPDLPAVIGTGYPLQ